MKCKTKGATWQLPLPFFLRRLGSEDAGAVLRRARLAWDRADGREFFPELRTPNVPLLETFAALRNKKKELKQ